MPKNSPPIIADFKSLYGVLGGSRSFYEGTAFHKKHGGIDFYIEIGSPVLAAGDGKVYGVKKKTNVSTIKLQFPLARVQMERPYMQLICM